MGRLFLVCLVLMEMFVASASPLEAASPEPYPYELAFQKNRFHKVAPLNVSADGDFLAYAMTSPTGRGVPRHEIYLIDLKKKSPDFNKNQALCPSENNQWGPVWSPDSRTLAFYSDAGDAPQLWLYERETRTCRRGATAPVRMLGFAGGEVQWGPDSEKLYIPVTPLPAAAKHPSNSAKGAGAHEATVSVRRSGAEVIPETTSGVTQTSPYSPSLLSSYNAAIAEVNLRNGETRVIVPAEAEPRPMIARLSPSGRWISYLSVFKRGPVGPATVSGVILDLAIAPTAGGGIQTVARGLPNLMTYDHSFYSWHPRKDMLVYLEEKKLWRADIDREGRVKISEIATELRDIAATIHIFTPDGKAVIVGVDPAKKISYKNPRPQGLALVPLDGGRVISLPLDTEKWSFEEVISGDGRTLWPSEPHTLTVKVKDKSNGEYALLRLNFKTGQQQVMWRGMAVYSTLTKGGPDGSLIGQYEDYHTPPDIFRFAEDFSLKTRLTMIEPRLNRLPVGRFQTFPVNVPLYDGTVEKLQTTVLLPPHDIQGTPPPAIVMIYPQSDLSEQAGFYGGGDPISLAAHLFVSRGFAVILPHVKIGLFGKAGHPLDEMVDVLRPQIYRAAALGYVDINRLGLAGHLYGGYGAAGIISQTKIFKAAVSLEGYYDFIGTYGAFLNGAVFGPGYIETGQGRMGTPPWADLGRYIENSPYYQADIITTPLLILKGETGILPREGEKMFNALHRFGRTAQLALYANEGYGMANWRPQNAADGARRMVKFFQKYLAKRTVN